MVINPEILAMPVNKEALKYAQQVFDIMRPGFEYQPDSDLIEQTIQAYLYKLTKS